MIIFEPIISPDSTAGGGLADASPFRPNSTLERHSFHLVPVLASSKPARQCQMR